MKKLQDLFNQAKQALQSFTASRTRVAIAFAIIAALVGAVLLLPPPSSSTELQAGPVQTVETTNDAATVVIDLPAPSTTDSAVVVDAAAADAVVDATVDEQPLPEETCAQ